MKKNSAICRFWMVAVGLLVLVIGCGSQSTIATFELVGLERPTAIYARNSRLYVVDQGHTVRMYDAKTHAPLGVFGRAGEHPGQFRLRPDHSVSLFFMDDRILINSDGKLSWFSSAGDFLYEKATSGSTLRYRPVGPNRLIYRGHATKGDSLFFTYMLCDSSLAPFKEICRVPNDWQPQSGLRALAISWDFYAEEGLIYIQDRRKGFCINVYDREGDFHRSIVHEHVPLPVTEAHRQGIIDFYRTSPYTRDRFEEIFKDRIYFPDILPAIRTWRVNEGRIYVSTFLEKKGRHELLVLDEEGKVLKRVFVLLPPTGSDIDRVVPYAIAKGRLYRLVQEADDGPWQLVVQPF